MIIYYNQDQDRDAITVKCMERLLYEENSQEDIEFWIKQGVEYRPLSEFDVDSGDYDCIRQMLSNHEVAYIIGWYNDEFVYVGKN